jgi:hypothetical protein
MDKILIERILGNRAHLYLKETINHFFKSDPCNELVRIPIKEFNKKLYYCNKVLTAGEQIFKRDCQKDKEQLLLIKLQIDLYLYSYAKHHIDPEDLEWKEIADYYRTKLYNQILIL